MSPQQTISTTKKKKVRSSHLLCLHNQSDVLTDFYVLAS